MIYTLNVKVETENTGNIQMLWKKLCCGPPLESQHLVE